MIMSMILLLSWCCCAVWENTTQLSSTCMFVITHTSTEKLKTSLLILLHFMMMAWEKSGQSKMTDDFLDLFKPKNGAQQFETIIILLLISPTQSTCKLEDMWENYYVCVCSLSRIQTLFVTTIWKTFHSCSCCSSTESLLWLEENGSEKRQ